MQVNGIVERLTAFHVRMTCYRLMLAPVYHLAIYALIKTVACRRGFIWFCIYMTASYLTLLPSQLLEFRYFLPGFIIIVLNSPVVVRMSPDDRSASASMSIHEDSRLQVSDDSDDNDEDKGIRTSNGSILLSAQLICIIFTVFDIILISIFMFKPFTWPDGSIARFMF